MPAPLPATIATTNGNSREPMRTRLYLDRTKKPPLSGYELAVIRLPEGSSTFVHVDPLSLVMSQIGWLVGFVPLKLAVLGTRTDTTPESSRAAAMPTGAKDPSIGKMTRGSSLP